MNDLQVFSHEKFGSVRSMLIDGEPWFVLRDVCDILGLPDAHKVASRLDDDEKGRNQIPTPGGKQRMTVINESGLYSVILRSDKPQAKPFRKWVTSEVLPAIRKTGQYAVPEIAEPATPTITVDDCLAAARLLASCRADRLPLVVSLLDQAGFDIDQTRLPQRFTRPRQIEENYDYFQYADISLYLRDDDDD